MPVTTNLLTQFVKDNPVKLITSAVTALGIIVGAAFTIDDRYAHAADVNKAQTTISNSLEINRLTNEVSVLQIRKSNLEDKLFESTVRSGTKKADPADAAIAERYKRELDSVNDQIKAKNELIDRLKTGVGK